MFLKKEVVASNGRKIMGGGMVEKVEGIMKGALPYTVAFAALGCFFLM
jgi:hypothetical protein